jgi:hypothetical protein
MLTMGPAGDLTGGAIAIAGWEVVAVGPLTPTPTCRRCCSRAWASKDLTLLEWATGHAKVAAASTSSSLGVDHSSTTRIRELGRYQTRWR